MFDFLLRFKNFKNIQDRFKLIAQGKIPAKSKDFLENKNGSSLIHYACLYNNLPLLKQCLVHLSIHCKNYWGETATQFAFSGRGYEVLDFLVSEYNLNVSSLLCPYGNPQWWSGFEESSFYNRNPSPKYSQAQGNKMDLRAYTLFLKKHNVDFNDNTKGQIPQTITKYLLSNYSFSALYTILVNVEIDYDKTVRLDSEGMTLAHWCCLMENGRAKAFEDEQKYPYPYIKACFNLIAEKSDYSLKNQEGLNVLEYGKKIGQSYFLNKVLSYHYNLQKDELNKEV